MDLRLSKLPKNPVIIEGFPGFGLVGSIALEFLIDHLKTEPIGVFTHEKMPAIVAIHENKLVPPISVHYCSEYNLLLVHALTTLPGMEWYIADAVIELAEKTKAKEIICIEGVGSMQESEEIKDPQVFYYSNSQPKVKECESLLLKPLKEGIVVGATSALLIKSSSPVTAFFAEAHTTMPDSKAAAKIIEALDKYLGLKVDYAPLLKKAENFENKLKLLIQQSKQAITQKEMKQLSYVG